MRQTLVLTAVLVACSSHAKPDAPTMCDPASQQVGAYLWQYTTVSGNCGTIASIVHVWPDNGVSTDEDGGGPACSIQANDTSEGGCKTEFAWSCTYANGVTWSYTRVLTQETQDGSMLSGILSEQASSAQGSCSGTYDVTLTRQ